MKGLPNPSDGVGRTTLREPLYDRSRSLARFSTENVSPGVLAGPAARRTAPPVSVAARRERCAWGPPPQYEKGHAFQ
jgi:hypothetical protein